MSTRLIAVRDAVGYDFADPGLLLQGLTHASWCDAQASDADRLAEANERLEFLGDTLLGAAVGLLLYDEHPTASEGELSRRKARLVSRSALAQAIEYAGLLPHCRVGSQMQEPWPISVRANLAEGLLAAVYLDGGWGPLRQAVARLLLPVRDHLPATPPADVKNRLQTWALEHHKQLPIYHSERSGGSDHEPEFTCTVTVAATRATGTGTSRRRAESAAARALLDHLGD